MGNPGINVVISADATKFVQALKEESDALGKSRAELLAKKAELLGVTDAASTYINNIQKASEHTHEFGFQTARSKTELLVLAHEMSQGNFQRFGGSMMVLGEQTGAAGLLFSGAGIAAIGLTAALGVAGYAMVKGAADQKAMNDALIMTGNYAGATSDSLNNLAHAAVATGGSLSEAKKVVTELAASGKYSADQIGTITDAVIAVEHATGGTDKSVEKLVRQFESLSVQASAHSKYSDEISKATVKLDDEYHFLTNSVYDQIRALEREGDQKAASKLATDEFAKATKERAEEINANLGTVARSWNAIKEAIGGAVDAIGDYGKKETAASRLAAAEANLKKIKDPVNRNNSWWTDDQVSAEEAKVVELRKELLRVNERAAEQGERQFAQSEANHASALISAMDLKYLKKGQSELTIELEKYRDALAKKEVAQPGYTESHSKEIKAMEAAITAAHSDKLGAANKADLDARVGYYQQLQTIVGSGEKRAEDELTARHAAGMLSDAEYYSQKRDLALSANTGLQTLTQLEIAAVNRSAVTQADKVRDVQKYKGELTKLQESAISIGAKFTNEMTVSKAKETKAFLEATAAAQQYIDTLNQTHSRELAGMGAGTAARSIAAGRYQIEDAYAKRTDANERFREANSTNGVFNNSDAKKKYDDELARIADFKGKAIEEYSSYIEAKKAKDEDWQLGAKEGLNNYLDDINNHYKSAGSIVTKSFKGMEDALVSFVKTGKLDFSSLADSIITDLIRIGIQQSMVRAMGGSSGLFGSLFGASGSGSATAMNGADMTQILAANGHAFGSSGMHAFRNGGTFTNQVVSKPTPFMFANGGGFSMGVMGEAGDEAVMPLTRGANGKLGVQASGMGGQTRAPNVTIVNNTSAQIGKVTPQVKADGDIAIVVEQAIDNAFASLSDANSRTSRHMSRAYSMQRSR